MIILSYPALKITKLAEIGTIFFKLSNGIGLFLLWTLFIYCLHRLAHYRNKFNLLYKIHLYHHKVDYYNEANRKFHWYYLFFYFGGIRETLDVIFMLTLPAVFIYLLFPQYGIYILAFHYLYEVFLSEGALDHNPRIRGPATRFFSWGQYHLIHHKTWKFNYSLIITLWDYVFYTMKKPSNSKSQKF